MATKEQLSKAHQLINNCAASAAKSKILSNVFI
jgi:hypothetical protein